MNHHEPPGTTTNNHQPPQTTTNHHEPTRTTTNHHEPSRTSTNHHEPPRSTTNHQEPPRTTTNHHEAPRTTTEHHEPPGITRDHHEPPRTTTNHHEPPRTTSKHHEPPRTTTNHHEPPRTTTNLGTQHPYGCWQGYRRVEIVALSSGVRLSCLQRIRGVNGTPLLGTRLDPGNSRSRRDHHVQATDQKKFNSKVLHMVWEARQRLWAPAHDVTENRGVTSRLPVYCTLCPCDSMRPDLRNSRSRCAQQATGIHDGIMSDTVRLVWKARL